MKNNNCSLHIWLIIFVIFFCPQFAAAAPVGVNSLSLYQDAAFTDSSIVNVNVNDGFYLKAFVNGPPVPAVPADYLLITCTHTSNIDDTVFIKLVQDSNDSYFYISDVATITGEGLSNSQLRNIGVRENSGETIWFSYGGTIFDSLVVTVAKTPVDLNNLNFMNAGYGSVLTGKVIPNSVLYVEANGVDGNELTIDTLTCYCTSATDVNGINILLTESGKNTGKYQGSFTLNSFSDDNQDYLQAEDSGVLIV